MRSVAVIGPSQTGKSTLVEAMGRLDGNPQRIKNDGGPDLVYFSFLGDDWVALDCAGGIETICQTQAALLAADAAIVCVSSDPAEAVLAAPYLHAVKRSQTPALLFISRIDEPRGRIRDVVAGLQDYTASSIVLRQIPIREGEDIVGTVDLISERAWRFRHGQPSDLIEIPENAIEREVEARSELLEKFSDFDDALLEELIEDRQPAAGPVYSIASRTLAGGEILPAFLGSPLNGNGIMRIAKALRHEAPAPSVLRDRLAAAAGCEPGAPPIAVTVYADYRQHAGKVVMVRALDDGLKQGRRIGAANLGSIQNGGARSAANGGGLDLGAIGLVVKSDHLNAGQVCTADSLLAPGGLVDYVPPMHARVLMATRERDDVKLSQALERLAVCDPGVTVDHDPATGRLVAHVQGPMALRALRHKLARDLEIEVEEEVCMPQFRETITKTVDVHYRHRKQTGGSGQFADVKLKVGPASRGDGFTFRDTIKGGAVPSNYIPAVEAGAREAMGEGPLGFPAVDLAVTLLDGQFHSVDSSDFAFRTAGRMGVKEAMAEASAVLLQPIHTVEIHVPSIYSGALVPLISSLHGQVLGFDRDPKAEGWDVFRALLPAKELDELAPSLRSATQGLASYVDTFDHYEEVYGREADAIVQARAAMKSGRGA